MTGKKMPPSPPELPPETDKIPDDFCLFHKGKISGEVYECPTCHTTYCLECAQKAREEGKKCIKCKQVILL
ncbi:MAG: hypothetical protein R6U96_18110 [Promethearchaeia archaeon]